MGFATNIMHSGKAIQAFLYIGFLGLIFLVIFGNVNISSIYGDHTSSSTTVTNYDAPNVIINESYVQFASTTIIDLKDISCSILNLTNGTDNQIIQSGNYTVGGTGNCYVQLTPAGTMWNGTDFNSSYSYTYNTYDTPDSVVNNLTAGVKTFFGFSNTIFTILAVILLIVILLAALAVVNKVFNKGNKGKGSGFSGY